MKAAEESYTASRIVAYFFRYIPCYADSIADARDSFLWTSTTTLLFGGRARGIVLHNSFPKCLLHSIAPPSDPSASDMHDDHSLFVADWISSSSSQSFRSLDRSSEPWDETAMVALALRSFPEYHSSCATFCFVLSQCQWTIYGVTRARSKGQDFGLVIITVAFLVK